MTRLQDVFSRLAQELMGHACPRPRDATQSDVLRVLVEDLLERQGTTTYSSQSEVLIDLDMRLCACHALLTEEAGWKSRVLALVTKLSDGDYPVERLQERWKVDTVVGRIDLAYALLPKGVGKEPAGPDFVDRLITVCRDTMEFGAEKDAGVLALVSTELQDMTSLTKGINGFISAMTLLDVSAVRINELLVDNAKRAFKHMIDRTSVTIVTIDAEGGLGQKDLELRDLAEHIARAQEEELEEARGDIDLSGEAEDGEEGEVSTVDVTEATEVEPDAVETKAEETETAKPVV